MNRRNLLLTSAALLGVPMAAKAQALLLGVSTAPAAGGGFALTFKSHNAGASGQTSPYTASSLAIGTASSDRIVVVAIDCNWGTSQTISNVTIGGNNATSAVTTASSSRSTEIWYLNVPTGTTATVVITASATWSRVAFDLYTITGTTQTAPFSTSGTASISVISTTHVDLPLTTGGAGVPTGGGAIATVQSNDTSAGTITWTQTTGSNTPDFNAVIGSSYWMSSMHTTSAANPQTLTATGQAGTNYRGAAISWGP